MVKVSFLGHSGFLVELEKTYLLFDYYTGELPELDEEKAFFVFASHQHYDHFNKQIFQYRDRKPEPVFILSNDILVEERADIRFVGANEVHSVKTLHLQTLRSTDEGVAFLVKCEGITIYHAGDLNWWHWEEEGNSYNTMMKRNYQHEIQKLEGNRIDLAFLPVDPRQGAHSMLGIDYFMRQTETSFVVPMHFWEDYHIFNQLWQEPCTEAYRERIIKIKKAGQQFLIELER